MPAPPRLGEDAFHEGLRLEASVHVRSRGGDLQPGDAELRGEVGGDGRRRLPELLGEREGGEGQVAVLGLGGLHLRADGVHRLPEGSGERGGEGVEEPVVEELGHRTERTGRTTEARVSSNFGSWSGFSKKPSMRSRPVPLLREATSDAPEMM